MSVGDRHIARGTDGVGLRLHAWTVMTSGKRRPSPQAAGVSVPMAEVSRHGARHDMWMVLDGVVYDVTAFAAHHPGGRDLCLTHAGRDATAAYRKAHAWVDHDAVLGAFVKGIVVAQPPLACPEVSDVPTAEKPKCVIS